MALRASIIENEVFPANLDLLVINAASETSIKIQPPDPPLDFIIVHNSDEDVITQVRGRYNGVLPQLYYHKVEDENQLKCEDLPHRFINKRLYAAEQQDLCTYLSLRRPNGTSGIYKMPKVKELLVNAGYTVFYRKDSACGGKHYYYIKPKCTTFEGL